MPTEETNIVTLIGFSGAGKSHLARALERQFRWHRFSCDELIEQQLDSLLPSHAVATERLASWLGQPNSKGFLERQEEYLIAEQNVLEKILRQLESASDKQSIVIDTTGSVIYLPRSVLSKLRELSQIVYLRLLISDEEQMFKQFLQDPKPLIWRDFYYQKPDESAASAVRRCYHLLYQSRIKQYEELAHVSYDVSLSTRQELSAQDFVKEIVGEIL